MQRVKNDKTLESLDLLAETSGDSVSAKGSEKANSKAAAESATESLTEPVFRKKVSKRTASVAALAAISDSTIKEEELEEELFKPLSPLVEAKSSSSQKNKAVAIVRPQPQQVISSGAKNNNSLVQHRESIDREARFSLYDFPSDSEGEDRPSSSASSPSKNLSQGMFSIFGCRLLGCTALDLNITPSSDLLLLSSFT